MRTRPSFNAIPAPNANPMCVGLLNSGGLFNSTLERVPADFHPQMQTRGRRV